MDKAEVRTSRIEIDQEKREYIDFANNEEITYQKKTALDRALNERRKRIGRLAPPRVLLIRKEKIEKTANIDEIIFYLKCMYSSHNEEPRFLLMIFQPTSLRLKQ